MDYDKLFEKIEGLLENLPKCGSVVTIIHASDEKNWFKACIASISPGVERDSVLFTLLGKNEAIIWSKMNSNWLMIYKNEDGVIGTKTVLVRCSN